MKVLFLLNLLLTVFATPTSGIKFEIPTSAEIELGIQARPIQKFRNNQNIKGISEKLDELPPPCIPLRLFRRMHGKTDAKTCDGAGTVPGAITNTGGHAAVPAAVEVVPPPFTWNERVAFPKESFLQDAARVHPNPVVEAGGAVRNTELNTEASFLFVKNSGVEKDFPLKVVFSQNFYEHHISRRGAINRSLKPTTRSQKRKFKGRNTLINPGQFDIKLELHQVGEFVSKDTKLQYHFKTKEPVKITEFVNGWPPRIESLEKQIDLVAEVDHTSFRTPVLKIVHYGEPTFTSVTGEEDLSEFLPSSFNP